MRFVAKLAVSVLLPLIPSWGVHGEESGELSAADVEFSTQTMRFDPKTNTFTVMELDPSPAPRVRGSFSYDSKRDRYVLFGGVLGQYSERFSDLWVLDPNVPAWTRIEAADAPTARGGYYGGAYDAERDSHLVVCGRHAPNHFLNDALALSIDEEAPGIARYVFDRSEFPTRDRLAVRWRDPGGAGPGLRLRTSEDGLAWSDWKPFEEGAVGSGARFVDVELRLHGRDLTAGTEILGLGFGDPEPAAGDSVSAISVPQLAPHLFGG